MKSRSSKLPLYPFVSSTGIYIYIFVKLLTEWFHPIILWKHSAKDDLKILQNHYCYYLLIAEN